VDSTQALAAGDSFFKALLAVVRLFSAATFFVEALRSWLRAL
jgi:hypothetical protein